MTRSTLTLRAVALVLDDHGYGEMADFVRWQDDHHKRTAFLYESTQGQLKLVLERLHKYEPPLPPFQPCSGKPSIWSDG